MSVYPRKNKPRKIFSEGYGRKNCDKEKLEEVLDLLEKIGDKLINLMEGFSEEDEIVKKIDEIIGLITKIHKIVKGLLPPS